MVVPGEHRRRAGVRVAVVVGLVALCVGGGGAAVGAGPPPPMPSPPQVPVPTGDVPTLPQEVAPLTSIAEVGRAAPATTPQIPDGWLSVDAPNPVPPSVGTSVSRSLTVAAPNVRTPASASVVPPTVPRSLPVDAPNARAPQFAERVRSRVPAISVPPPPPPPPRPAPNVVGPVVTVAPPPRPTSVIVPAQPLRPPNLFGPAERSNGSGPGPAGGGAANGAEEESSATTGPSPPQIGGAEPVPVGAPGAVRPAVAEPAGGQLAVAGVSGIATSVRIAAGALIVGLALCGAALVRRRPDRADT